MNSSIRRKTHTSFDRLWCVLYFSILFFFAPICTFTQEDADNTENKSAEIAESNTTTELERIRKTLQFGTDNAVVESIKTLNAMALASFVPDVMKHMRSSKSEKVLVESFTYLRSVESTEALELAISLVKNFKDYPVRAMQFAFFYIQDAIDSFTDEMKTTLSDIVVRILEDDSPALSLTVLSILPRYYSEEDEPYYGDSFFDEDAAIKNVPLDIDNTKNRLISLQLIKIYENILTAVVQDEILITLGKIQAYNALPFILKLVEDRRRISQSQRRAIIIALGSFDLRGDILNRVRERRFEVFEEARKDPSAKIRKAFIQALHIYDSSEDEQYMESDGLIPQWLLDGMRDDDISVRQAVLTRIRALFDSFAEEDRAVFFDAVSFMAEYDVSDAVQAKAVKALSKFPQGKTLVLNAVKGIETLNTVNSTYIELALADYANDGGVEALKTLVEKIIDESKQKQTFFSDSLALIQEISHILAAQNEANISDIVALMIQHPDTTVQKNMLTVIAKNKFTQFLETVQQMSQDVAVPAATRVHAKRTAEVLKDE